MDLGERRRSRREQLRRKHGTTPLVRQDTAVAALVLTVIVAVSVAGGVAHMPIATALNDLYCTPAGCASLPQVLTGLAVAAAPLAVFFWRRDAAFYLYLLLAGFAGTVFITSNQDVMNDGLWALPLTYFLTSLLVVPFTALLLHRNRA
ncbi:hypothetical protein UK23_07545 [Lentzea aerocolonigenes]|uniref:Uncharacterized protein n=1 Tax=Lentzea aerocolonigenes TaxID=68170 RepID=A0A0F0HCF8_LENAE|nr:hypothetical protein [Lentzea aerocolonigenes]KJK51333.1 hypothetical protein UK23_07545 [Lentzea aerocolonigenes]